MSTALSSRWRLDGRKCVVTGGSKGLGLACVRELLELGADVLFCGRSAHDLITVHAELVAQYGAGRVVYNNGDIYEGEWTDGVLASFASKRGKAKYGVRLLASGEAVDVSLPDALGHVRLLPAHLGEDDPCARRAARLEPA